MGQTVNPEQRYKAHKSAAFNENNSEYDTPLHRAIRKYGFDNFDYEVLAESDNIEILNDLEVYFITKLNTQIPNGYNIEAGGKNCTKPKTQEQKIKLTWGQAKLTLDEIVDLRIAYANHQSPKQIYEEKYKDLLHYNSFLNIWSGRRYKNIMPEVIEKGRHTKLTQDIANAIRKDYKTLKLSYTALAEKYHISKSTVADIISNRTWVQKQ